MRLALWRRYGDVMATYGDAWQRMATHGDVWQRMATHGDAWQRYGDVASKRHTKEVKMNENHIWRWGIIGPGRIAESFAKGLTGAPNGKLQAVGSSNIARAEAFAQKFGGERAYGSHAELLADPDVDVVYIATLNPQHAGNIEDALNAGKHVLCEKPFTLNHGQAERLVALARSKNLFMMEAMWTRMHPITRQVMGWIEEGQIGEVIGLDASFGFSGTTNEDLRVIDLAKGGSALMDVGIYPVSYASMLFGSQPQRLTAYADQLPSGVDITNSIMFDYGQGRYARLSSSVVRQFDNSATITGTRGAIKVSHFWHPDRATLHGFKEGNQFTEPYVIYEPVERVNGYEYEAEHVNECLTEGRTESLLMPLDETVAIMATMDEIRNSWNLVYPGE